ncbi:hypothetical protein WR25_20821 [Diploscapter pachys]|uniref:Uncharacterized protein n=1 Tax=Diploscapter pachys TaxID=2018661 RepID=A0A2A2LE81_9BILA|nr:hypothetical protein WR25_20821 [Diploscapter pachys]
MMRGPNCKKLDSKGKRYLFGLVHLRTAMIFILLLGSAIILALITFFFMKMPKALFLLLIPTLVVGSSTAAMLARIKHFMYPLIAISMFHVVLSSYLMMVFLFYFLFKPLYIIMVLNWLWDTQHGTKTTSFYVQCGIFFVLLVLFIAFNVWQAIVSIDYRKHLKRENSGMPIRR